MNFKNEQIIINLSSIEQTDVVQKVDKSGLIQLHTASGKDYFDMLCEKYHHNSATHSNFINLKKDLIAGEFYSDTQSAESLQFIKDNEGSKVLEKVGFDLSLFETAFIQVIWNMDHTSIREFYHLDRTCVTPITTDDKGRVCEYAVSKCQMDNKKKKFSSYDPYPAFDPKQTEEFIQILEIRRYSPGNQFVTIPSYNSVLNYIDIEKELSQFHLASVSNGFFSSAVLNIQGSPTEDQKREFIQNFKNSFNGSKNASKMLFNFNSDEFKIELTPLQVNNNSDLFNTLNNIAIQKIATGHRGSLDLAGVTTQGADLGGDANKLFISYNLFKNNVTDPLQKLAEEGFNKILSANGLPSIGIKSELPVQLYPQHLLDILTEDEKRKIFFGLGPAAPNNNDNTKNPEI